MLLYLGYLMECVYNLENTRTEVIIQPMKGNPRQSQILNSSRGIWIPGTGFSGSWIPDQYDFGFLEP